MRLYTTTALALVTSALAAQSVAAQTISASPTMAEQSDRAAPGFHFVPAVPVLIADWKKAHPANVFKGNVIALSRAKPKSSGTGGTTVQAASMRAGGTVAPEVPTDIAILAQSLNYDPDLIYQFVRDNIEIDPVFGIHKGGAGALIDRQGSAADQAELMADLLRASGYQASIVQGLVVLTKAQIQSFYGINTASDCAIQNYFAAGRIPVDRFLCTTPDTSLGFLHFWVRVTINGQTFDFDPSQKAHVVKPAINLKTASGYTQSAFMADSDSGATVSTTSVTHLNRAAVRNDLTNYSNNLIAFVRANSPAASLDDIVGGKTISVPTTRAEAPTRQSRLPYEANYPETIYAGDVAVDHRNILQLSTGNITVNLVADSFYGSRLTINSDSSNNVQLLANGNLIATFNQLAPGATQPLTVGIFHNAYQDSGVNGAFTKTLTGGETMTITMGFGPSTHKLGDGYRQQIAAAKDGGAPDASEPVVAGGLSAIGADIQAQLAMTAHLTDQVGGVNTVIHHFIGTVTEHDGGPVTDLKNIYMTTIQQDNNVGVGTADFISNTMHASAFESGVLEQVFQSNAASTVRLIDDAIAGGETIYSATAANFASAVQPNLQNCSASEISTLSTYANTFRVILPQNCARAVDLWQGLGYILVNPDPNNLYVGMMIDGGYNGGYLGLRRTLNSADYKKAHPWINWWSHPQADPVDMATGNFIYSHDDLVTGEASFPKGLGFQKIYNSAAQDFDGALGRGWSPNVAMRLDQTTQPFQGLGEDSPIDAATSIVETMVSLDLLGDPNLPLDKIATSAMTDRWFADQLNNNAVALSSDVQGQMFVKLPDGTYNSPPDNSSKLIKNADGSFTQSRVDKSTYEFDTTGNVSAWKNPNGLQVHFTYTGGQLTGVQNSFGRSLTLAYTGNHITSVQDGSGRSVSYGYDANGNMTTFTDANGKVTTFEYDQPGRITKFYLPANPTLPQVINSYDALGRVQQQTDANGKVWQILVAGTRSELKSPLGNRGADYYDGSGRVISTLKDFTPGNPASANWMVDEQTFVYDGLGRLSQSTSMVDPSVQLTYDDASCNSAEKRCTNNAKTRTVPAIVDTSGGGSSLAAETQSFTYEGQFNKLLTATDARGKVANYVYDAVGNLTTVTLPPAVDNGTLRPTTTIGYTSYAGPAGFPSFTLPTSMTKKIDASNNVTEQMTYDTANGFQPKTDVMDSGGLNLTTTYGYNSAGDLTSVDGPRTDVSDVTTMGYDGERRLTTVTNALGKVAKTNYNDDGAVTSIAHQFGTQWLATCNVLLPSDLVSRRVGSAIVTASDQCPTAAAPTPITDFAYDDDGRVATDTLNLASLEGGSRTSRYSYSPSGKWVMTEAAVGTGLQQTSARAGLLNYSLYHFVTLFSPRNAAPANNFFNSSVDIKYDGHGRLGGVWLRGTSGDYCGQDPAGYGCEQYAYDVDGNLTKWTRRDDQILSYAYDNLNRVTQRSAPVSADGVAYTYDLLGRTLSATYVGSGGASVTYTYDKAGRVLTTTSGGRTVSYQYDGAGNRTRTTWPDAAFYVTYDYDALNRVSAIKEKGTTLLASYAYDDVSRRTGVTYGNTTTIGYGYDAQSQLQSQTIDLAGTAADLTRTFARDQAGELTGLTTSNASYDWNGYYNINRPYTVDQEERYLTSGSKSLTYDRRANLTGDGTWTFTYDIYNRLKTAVVKNVTNVSYVYDPVNRLASKTSGKTVTNYLYDGNQLIGEYNSSGTLVRRYIPGAAMDDAVTIYDGTNVATKTWLYPDQQGSVTATANASGSSLSTMSYGPFGEPNVNTGVSLRYTGQYLDSDTGLYYYKARWYSPYLGRFLSPDPALLIDGLQTYKYVDNNPLDYSDPGGLIRQLGKDALKMLPKHCSGTASQHPWLNNVALGADVVQGGSIIATPFAPEIAVPLGNYAGKVSAGIDSYEGAEAAYHAAQGNYADVTNYGVAKAEGGFLRKAFRKFWPVPAQQLRIPNGQYAPGNQTQAARPLGDAAANIIGDVCP